MGNHVFLREMAFHSVRAHPVTQRTEEPRMRTLIEQALATSCSFRSRVGRFFFISIHAAGRSPLFLY